MNIFYNEWDKWHHKLENYLCPVFFVSWKMLIALNLFYWHVRSNDFYSLGTLNLHHAFTSHMLYSLNVYLEHFWSGHLRRVDWESIIKIRVQSVFTTMSQNKFKASPGLAGLHSLVFVVNSRGWQVMDYRSIVVAISGRPIKRQSFHTYLKPDRYTMD